MSAATVPYTLAEKKWMYKLYINYPKLRKTMIAIMVNNRFHAGERVRNKNSIVYGIESYAKYNGLRRK